MGGERLARGAAPAVAERVQEAGSGGGFALPRGTAEYYGLGGGERLPGPLCGKLESSFGADLSAVRVHQDGRAASMDAVALTQGSHIHFSPGSYAPSSSAGQRLIGHEVTHVLQQAAGGVTMPQGKDGAINADPELEAQADVLGERAAAGQPARGVLPVNAAVAERSTGAVQCGGREVEPVVKKVDDLLTMTIGELDDHVRAQVNWHEHVEGMTDEQHQRLVNVLLFVRNTPGMVSACPQLTVNGAHGLTDVQRRHLAWFAGAKSQQLVTIYITAEADSLAQALLWGENIGLLHEALGGGLLRQIMTQETFFRLISDNIVDTFIAYVAKARPTLHARDGAEVWSFIQFCQHEDPLTWVGQMKWVRNLHRFLPSTLRRLQEYENGDNPNQLQVMVLVQSRFDHNGAFHQNQQIQSAVLDGKNWVLLIECSDEVPSLAAVAMELGWIEGWFGKISQLMFIGHGSSRSMQLGGTVTKTEGGRNQPKHESLNLNKNEQETVTLLNEVLDHLDDDALVVFASCLTDSNVVKEQTWVCKVPTMIRAKLTTAITQHASLSQTLRDLAKKRGKSIDVLGAKGSFTTPTLYDQPSGQLTLRGDNDHYLLSPVEEYVEHGLNPEGVMAAALQSWVNNSERFMGILNRRLLRNEKDWSNVVIRTLFNIISKAKGVQVPERIVQLTRCAITLDQCENPYLGTIQFLTQYVPDELADVIFGNLFSAGNFKCQLAVQLAWSCKTGKPEAHQRVLHLLCDPSLTCGSLSQMQVIDIYWLFQTGHLDKLLAVTGKRGERGRLLLALHALVESNQPLSCCVNFLTPYLNKKGKFHEDVGVTELLGGTARESTILALLGIKQEERDYDFNFNWNGGKLNDLEVKSLTSVGRVKPGTPLLLHPGGEAVSQAQGETLLVIGRYENWYVVQHGKKSAFVAVDDVELTSETSLQMKVAISGGVEGAEMEQAGARGIAGAGAALPFLSTIQHSFGRHDVSGAKAHTDGGAQEAARDMGAEAYAMHGNVAFAGTPTLHTAAHEAAHLVQQQRGVQLKGGPGGEWEQHADAVADLVVQGRPAESMLDRSPGLGAPVQRQVVISDCDEKEPDKVADYIVLKCQNRGPYKQLLPLHGAEKLKNLIVGMITDGTNYGTFKIGTASGSLSFLEKLTEKIGGKRELPRLVKDDVVLYPSEGYLGVVLQVEGERAEIQWIRNLKSNPDSREYANDETEWKSLADLEKSSEKVNLKEPPRPKPREPVTVGEKGPSGLPPLPLTGSATAPLAPALKDSHYTQMGLPRSDKDTSGGRVAPKDLSFVPSAFHMAWSKEDKAAGTYIEQMALVGSQEGFVVVALVREDQIPDFYKSVDNRRALENVVIRPVETVRDTWAEDNGEFHTGGTMHVPARVGPQQPGSPAQTIGEGRKRRNFYMNEGDDKQGDISRVGARVSEDRSFDDKVVLGHSSNVKVYENRSHIEGGNLLSGKTVDGKGYLLVGRDGVEATRALIAGQERKVEDVVDGQVKQVISVDYGIAPEMIFFVEQPGEFHLDMSMVLMGPSQVIVNDAMQVYELQERWIREDYQALKETTEPQAWLELGGEVEGAILDMARHAKRMAPYEKRSAQQLLEAGFKVQPVAGAFPPSKRLPAMNFLNGEGGIGRDHQPFFVTNGGDTRAEQYIAQQYLKALGTGLERVHFVDPAASKESLKGNGGLGCRAKGEGTAK